MQFQIYTPSFIAKEANHAILGGKILLSQILYILVEKVLTQQVWGVVILKLKNNWRTLDGGTWL